MPQDILITPYKDSTSSGAKIDFTGFNSGASTITMRILPDSTLSYEGTAGQLFSISNGLSSGTIFSVNDISGIPSFDVNANGLVRIAPFAGNVALGTTATSGKLQINTGSATTIGQIIQGASGQTANYLNITSTSGFIAGFSADGTLYTTAMVGSPNTVTNINGTVNSSGFRATVVGYGASVTGTSQGTAIGYGATAQNNGTQALGQSASATGLYATAIGSSTSAAGTASVAIGFSCSAPYSRSVAIGRSAVALAAGDFVYGDDANDKKFVLQKASSTGDYRYQTSWGALWIDSTDATHAARATFNTYYATTAQEAIRIDSASDLARVGIGGAASGRLCVYTGVAGNKGLVVQGFTSQTANLTEWQNSAGTVLSVVNASGSFGLGTSSPAYRLNLVGGNEVGSRFSVTGTYAPVQFTGDGSTTVGGVNAYSNIVTFGRGTATGVNPDIVVNLSGSVGIGTTAPGGQFQVTNSTAGLIPAIIRGATSQTANLLELQDSAGNYVGAMNAGGSLSFEVNSPNISGTVSNLVTSGSYFVRLNCTWSGSALTGVAPITGGSHVNGKLMRLYNGGSQPMKLTNMATSTATNRFYCYNSGDLWLSVGDYYECIYDTIAFNGTSSGGAWRVNA